jgi:site-specific recombinase XerD
MIKSHLTLVAPTTENRTVTPLRRPNAELRTREHLTADEVEALMTAARGNRYGHRNSTMILLAYRHGLRARELFDHRASEADGKRESGTSAIAYLFGSGQSRMAVASSLPVRYYLAPEIIPCQYLAPKNLSEAGRVSALRQ